MDIPMLVTVNAVAGVVIGVAGEKYLRVVVGIVFGIWSSVMSASWVAIDLGSVAASVSMAFLSFFFASIFGAVLPKQAASFLGGYGLAAGVLARFFPVITGPVTVAVAAVLALPLYTLIRIRSGLGLAISGAILLFYGFSLLSLPLAYILTALGFAFFIAVDWLRRRPAPNKLE